MGIRDTHGGISMDGLRPRSLLLLDDTPRGSARTLDFCNYLLLPLICTDLLMCSLSDYYGRLPTISLHNSYNFLFEV